MIMIIDIETVQTEIRAFDLIFKLGVIPMSIEKKSPPEYPTRSEIRRWLDQKAVRINGTFPNSKDMVTYPITDLVFFPKSAKRKTTVI